MRFLAELEREDAVVASTMDLLGWLRKHLEAADTDLLREMVLGVVQALMSAEADAACGAGHGERSADRVNQRNGYRKRRLDTRVGTLELAIPKLRAGSYFPDWLLEPRRRAERALVAVVAECLGGWGVHPPGRGAGGDPWDPEPVQVPGLRAGQDPGRRGGGVPGPAAGRWPVCLCVGGRVGGQGRADRECRLRGRDRRERRRLPGDPGGGRVDQRGRRRLDELPARPGGPWPWWGGVGDR
jgi:putative transposase